MSQPQPSRVSFQLTLVAAFAAVYTIWGSTYLAIRFAVETMPPFLMAGARFIIAGGLLMGWVVLRGGARPTWAQWKAAVLVGALLFVGGNGLVSWAEQRIPSSLAASLIATVPLWMVLLDWARPGGVRPNRGVIAGLVIGFAGVVALLGPGKASGDVAIDLVGALTVLLASVLWAGGSLLSRAVGLPRSATLSSGMQMFAGGALLLGAGTAAGEWGQLNLSAISLQSLLAWAYLIFFGAIVGFSAYAWLLRVSTPARVATHAYVNPVVAVFLGWALGNEPLTPQTLLASAFIIGAVAVVTVNRTHRNLRPRRAEAIPAQAAPVAGDCK
ncbi:MAG: drug/metabolite exporter YedA [Anaerolineae bacterium]